MQNLHTVNFFASIRGSFCRRMYVLLHPPRQNPRPPLKHRRGRGSLPLHINRPPPSNHRQTRLHTRQSQPNPLERARSLLPHQRQILYGWRSLQSANWEFVDPRTEQRIIAINSNFPRSIECCNKSPRAPHRTAHQQTHHPPRQGD